MLLWLPQGPPPQPQDEELPWGLLVWVVIFIGLPLAGKILSWVMGKISPEAVKRPAAPGSPPGPQGDERPAEPPEEVDFELEFPEVEPELAETPPPPPPPPPAHAPAPRPLGALAELSHLRREDLSALEPLQTSTGPGVGGLEAVLQARDRRARLGPDRLRDSLRDPRARGDLPVAAGELDLDASRDATYWRRAILLTEVLAAPVALRPPGAPGAPRGVD